MSTTQRLRPVERRVLRWVDAGLDDAEIGRRFGRGERWTAQVRRLARLDVPRTGSEDDAAGAPTDAATGAAGGPTDAAASEGAGESAGGPTDAASRDGTGGSTGGAREAATRDRAGGSPADAAPGDRNGERADGSGRDEAATRLRLRPLERRVLRWRAQGADHEELAPRFRRSPEFLARVEEYAQYKLAGAG